MTVSIVSSPISLLGHHMVVASESTGESQFTTGPALTYMSHHIEEEEDVTIEKAVAGLREYYAEKSQLNFKSALGYNYTSNDLEGDLGTIMSKFKTNENPNSALSHVGNIMGLIAGGKDPYNYNGQDYVKPLAEVQNKDGKFIIGGWDDSATTQASSVLALDMAGADYDKSKAKKALLGYQEANGSFGSWENVEGSGTDEVGMVLGALAKYKEDTKVQAAIAKGLAYLKKAQDPHSGGFITWGAVSPDSAAAVIQGLIALGQDPLSEEWTKGGKTPVDSLLSFYKDGHFQNDYTNEGAFMALADLYREKSMYNELKFNANPVDIIVIQKPTLEKIRVDDQIKLYATGYDGDGKIVPTGDLVWTSSHDEIATIDDNGNMLMKAPGKTTITGETKDGQVRGSIEIEVLEKEFDVKYVGDESVNQGEQGNAKVRIKNLTASQRPVTLMIGLYNKETHELTDYSMVSKHLASEEEIDLSAGVLVPTRGSYYIKVFVWDDLSKQNIIMRDAKEITINQ